MPGCHFWYLLWENLTLVSYFITNLFRRHSSQCGWEVRGMSWFPAASSGHTLNSGCATERILLLSRLQTDLRTKPNNLRTSSKKRSHRRPAYSRFLSPNSPWWRRWTWWGVMQALLVLRGCWTSPSSRLFPLSSVCICFVASVALMTKDDLSLSLPPWGSRWRGSCWGGRARTPGGSMGRICTVLTPNLTNSIIFPFDVLCFFRRVLERWRFMLTVGWEEGRDILNNSTLGGIRRHCYIWAVRQDIGLPTDQKITYMFEPAWEIWAWIGPAYLVLYPPLFLRILTVSRGRLKKLFWASSYTK